MALLEDAITEIPDPQLRARTLAELRRLKGEKRFGLVFEEHLPELIPLYSARVRPGSRVAKRAGPLTQLFLVHTVIDGVASCSLDIGGEAGLQSFPVEDLVVVKRFGEPIYPTLVPVEQVDRVSGKPAHVLVEADNYHALQLLEYVYAGQVDCIYLDPPYNTGARDWKYNNDYVDANDQWRHSKWLSFMQKRLRLAKKLLRPENGVLIVTIDEHEVHHLGMLLEQLFPEAYRQLVTIVVNPKGVTQGRFSRVEEYAIFCFMKDAYVLGKSDDLLTPAQDLEPPVTKPRWKGLLRSGTNARRIDRRGLFYPVLVDPVRGAVLDAGDPLPLGLEPDFEKSINGLTPVWPVRSDGSLGNWGVGPGTLRQLIQKGYVGLGGYDEKRRTYGLSYLSKKLQAQIETGAIRIMDRDPLRNVVNVEYVDAPERQIKAVWHRTLHDAGAYGSDLLRSILGQGRLFSFPKSLYAVRDALGAVVRDRPNALILDFFAGSGTTLHATALLNQEDGGSRQCILVTNNEVSAEEVTKLQAEGVQPGSPTWERHGICQSVTFPRCKFVLKGKRNDGTDLPGTYLTGRKVHKETARTFRSLGFTTPELLADEKTRKLLAPVLGLTQSKLDGRVPWYIQAEEPVAVLFAPEALDDFCEAIGEYGEHITTIYLPFPEGKSMRDAKALVEEVLSPYLRYEEETGPCSNGFDQNLHYFHLDFLDSTAVELGLEFQRILPILWLMAGGKGPIPGASGDEPYIFPEGCSFGVLLQETAFAQFRSEAAKRTGLTHIFLVTDSDEGFATMRSGMKAPNVVQLYRNYLENFRINTGDR